MASIRYPFGLTEILFSTKKDETESNRLLLLLLSAPATGGFVVVGHMFVGCLALASTQADKTRAWNDNELFGILQLASLPT